jgi:hypothetical protein
MKTCGKLRYSFHTFLTSVIGRSELSGSRVSLLVISKHFITIILLFITVYLFHLHIASVIIHFTVVSPTPHPSTILFGNLAHSRDEAYSADSKV